MIGVKVICKGPGGKAVVDKRQSTPQGESFETSMILIFIGLIDNSCSI